MKDESRVLLNTLLAWASRAVAAVAGILIVPFLLYRLGDTTYGLIGITVSMLALVELIELGLRPAVTRQYTRFLYGEDARRANEVASSSLAVYGLLGAAVVGLTAAGGAALLRAIQVAPELRDEAWLVLVIASGSLGALLLRAPYEAALASQLRFDINEYTQIFGALFRPLFIVVMFWLWEPRVEVWALAALVASVLILAVQRRQAHRCSPTLRLAPSLVTRRGLSDLAGFGAYTSLLRLALWLNEQSGPLVLSFFLGTAAVALYTPAVVLSVSLQPLWRGFLSQLTPVVTRAHATGDIRPIERVLVRSTRYALLVGGGPVVVVAALAPTLIEAWLGPGYEVTAWVLVAWSARSLMQQATGAAFPVFMGTGNLAQMALLNVVLGALGLGLAVALVAWTDLGALGPALAVAATQLPRSLVYFAYTTRIVGISRTHILRESFIGPSICLLALAAAALALQTSLSLAPLAELFACAIPSLALYAALAWSLGLTEEDREKVRSYARRGAGLALARARRGSAG